MVEQSSSTETLKFRKIVQNPEQPSQSWSLPEILPILGFWEESGQGQQIPEQDKRNLSPLSPTPKFIFSNSSSINTAQGHQCRTAPGCRKRTIFYLNILLGDFFICLRFFLFLWGFSCFFSGVFGWLFWGVFLLFLLVFCSLKLHYVP